MSLVGLALLSFASFCLALLSFASAGFPPFAPFSDLIADISASRSIIALNIGNTRLSLPPSSGIRPDRAYSSMAINSLPFSASERADVCSIQS